MEISSFTEKLNRVSENIYVIEEEVVLTKGVYEAPLQHDNVDAATLSVYTGPKLTGEKIENYTLSTPSLAPWKRLIRIHADVPAVYISYETQGDTVEAEDANLVQQAVVKTQEALNLEAERAVSAEEQLYDELQKEVTRSQTAENALAENLGKETERAKGAEKALNENLGKETMRAESAEAELKERLSGEKNRAESVETLLENKIQFETERAKTAETTLAEQTANEIKRASDAESEINHYIRLKQTEWDDKYSRNEIDNKFSTLETAIDWKEAVETYDDLGETYPNPDDGWTVNVKDTDYTYRWSGEEWVAISANSIPTATQEVNGLLSKEDKILYDDANRKKHVHENSSVLQKVTQPILDKLDRIEDGARKNVQPDWKVSDLTADAYIKNKPSSLPASGGNADTVNGHSVHENVPKGAKFTDTLYTVFQGSGEKTEGTSGLVPAPASGEPERFLRADGTWRKPADGAFVRKAPSWNELMGV